MTKAGLPLFEALDPVGGAAGNAVYFLGTKKVQTEVSTGALDGMLRSVVPPIVGRHGYSAVFFFGAACSVVYFLAAAFLLPETRGKTLEEIEAHFAEAKAG